MSVYPWRNRWDSLREIQREVGRLFESFEPLSHFRTPRPFPALNLIDAGDRFLIIAFLPGVAPEEVDLSITGETLTIRGERKRAEGISDECYRRQERQFGRWSRTLTLPDRVNSEAVTAHFAQGLLTITLPKLESSQPRQINVTDLNPS